MCPCELGPDVGIHLQGNSYRSSRQLIGCHPYTAVRLLLNAVLRVALCLPSCLQREWRRVRAHRSAAALVIQACWRGHAVRKHNGWMRRLLDRCTKRYEALKQDRYVLCGC